MNKTTRLNTDISGLQQRVAIYARVSSREQAERSLPDCEAQVVEAERYCTAKGWQVVERIQDEGYRAGTLERPGLSRLRLLIENGEIKIVICTWHNRLVAGAALFAELNRLFKRNGVKFITINTPADRGSASDRFTESLLVAVKAFENEQISEKVRVKRRQRAEQGLWNGGTVPFGYRRFAGEAAIEPDPQTIDVVRELFRICTKTQSVYPVQTWLHSQQIQTAKGNRHWSLRTIRTLLTNRLYNGEIKINRGNRGIADLTDEESYKAVKAPHYAIVPQELFEAAQDIVGRQRVGRRNE